MVSTKARHAIVCENSSEQYSGGNPLSFFLKLKSEHITLPLKIKTILPMNSIAHYFPHHYPLAQSLSMLNSPDWFIIFWQVLVDC